MLIGSGKLNLKVCVDDLEMKTKFRWRTMKEPAWGHQSVSQACFIPVIVPDDRGTDIDCKENSHAFFHVIGVDADSIAPPKATSTSFFA